MGLLCIHIFIVLILRIFVDFLPNFCKNISIHICINIYKYEVRNLHRISDKQSSKNNSS